MMDGKSYLVIPSVGLGNSDWSLGCAMMVSLVMEVCDYHEKNAGNLSRAAKECDRGVQEVG